MLESISLELIPEFRDLFLKSWPKYISSYGAIDNYYKWIQGDPALKNEISFLSIGSWREHGTYIIQDLKFQRMFCGTFDTEEGRENLEKALSYYKQNYNLIDMISPFDMSLKSIVMNSVDRNLFEINYEEPANFYYMTKKEASELEIEDSPGYTFGALQEIHAEVINSFWTGKSNGSLELIKQLIRANENLGMFDVNGELVGWVLRRKYGTVGMLHIMESQRKKGLGYFLAKNFVKQSGERGQDITVSIFMKNTPSIKIFTKLGFRKIGENYRCSFKCKN